MVVCFQGSSYTCGLSALSHPRCSPLGIKNCEKNIQIIKAPFSKITPVGDGWVEVATTEEVSFCHIFLSYICKLIFRISNIALEISVNVDLSPFPVS